MHFGQCVSPLSLSTRSVYLHATKACSHVIGQYHSDYKWTTNGNQNTSDIQIWIPYYRLCYDMQISVHRDSVPKDPHIYVKKQKINIFKTKSNFQKQISGRSAFDSHSIQPLKNG